MRVGGWTAIGGVPDAPKAVIIAAPHTSNWDGFWALVYKVAIGLDVHFFAKHSLFWFPLSTLLQALGAVELDRKRAGSAVQQAVDMFRGRDSYYFGLAPEGTRKKKPGWKNGFYRIAVEAGVPVGIGRRFDLSGDQEADLAALQEFYSAIQGHHPEQTSPIRFV